MKRFVSSKILLSVIAIITVLLFAGCSLNAVKEDAFKKGINKFIDLSINDFEYEVEFKDKKMIVSDDDIDYVLTYDLKDNPTIIYEFDVKKGISYDDYNLKLSGILTPILGYIGVSYTHGLNLEDSNAYFYENFIEGIFNAMSEIDNNYVIVDDPEYSDDDSIVILVEEFGDKVIEYIKAIYKKPIVVKDAKHNTFTYELFSNCKKDSCTVTSKVTVNNKGDFDEIKNYAQEIAKKYMDDSITTENADYHIELFVGDSITITGKDLTGYEKSGMNIIGVDSDDKGYIFEATVAGIANGYFYIGEEDERTFYITVKEAPQNHKSENKTLTVE